METHLLGKAFCGVTSDVWAVEMGSLTYPVAVGHAAAVRDLPLGLTAQMFLQAFAANLVACATRLVPLGQTEGQRLIRDLTPLCQRVAKRKRFEIGLDALGSTAFLARHRVDETRNSIFKDVPNMSSMNGPLRVGIGGPVGAGKTTLTAALSEALRDKVSVGVITNDIYTREDAEALMRMQILPQGPDHRC